MRTNARRPEIIGQWASPRTAALLLLLSALGAAQDFTQNVGPVPPDVPATRAADTYAVYSAALGDRPVTYWIADHTAIDLFVLKEVLDARAAKPCATPPEGDSRAFREAIDDLRQQSQVAYRLEDRFQFQNAKVRMAGADEIQRDRLSPYRLSSVGFSKNRSLALVVVDNVHPRAGSEWLSILKRTARGWEEQKWKNDCWIIAKLAGPVGGERAARATRDEVGRMT